MIYLEGRRWFGVCACLVICVLLLVFGSSRAQESFDESRLNDIEFLEGPGEADIGDNAEINISEGFLFTGKKGTEILMEYFENPLTGAELGFVTPEDGGWYVVFEFGDIGYVKDDEKDQLDADAILKSLREGNEEGNKERRKRGWSTFTVDSWLQPPHYDPQTHNLEWCTKLVSVDNLAWANYNTRVLGRRGVMNVTLVIEDLDSLDNIIPQFKSLLSGFTFKPDDTYGAYRAGDKIAEYGLTALVVGGVGAAAAKGGMFKWLWKLLVAAAAGIGAFFKKIFGRKDEKIEAPSA